MDRKEFIGLAAPAAIGLSVFPDALFAKGPKGLHTARDLNAYLRSLVEVDEPSVDKIIVGNPDTGISKIGCAWMPYWSTLKEARAKGVNTLVVHEPTFYAHWDLDQENDMFERTPSPAKHKYVEAV